MRLIANLLFSITILLTATPALAKGDGGEDRSIAAEVQNSKLAEYYYYRGNVYYHMDKYDDAIRDYDLAIKLRRNYADAYYNRGLALMARACCAGAWRPPQGADLQCISLSASKWTGQRQAKIIEIERSFPKRETPCAHSGCFGECDLGNKASEGPPVRSKMDIPIEMHF